MPQLFQLSDVILSQLLWLAVGLGFIFFVIARGMVPKIQAGVDERERKIAADLEAAQAARDQAESTEAEYRKQIEASRAEAMKVAGWSEAHYVDMMPHNPLGPICTAATIHFAAAVANFAWLETRASPGELYHGFDDAGIFPVQPKLNGAVYEVPDGPGLGVEVDEALVRKQSFKFWEAPHLRRTDGSVTNW